MDFALSPKQRRQYGEMEDFGASLGLPSKSHTFDRQRWGLCGKQGLTGLAIPQAYDGLGHDALTTALLLEAFGKGCRDSGLVFSVAAHLLAGAVPIWKMGQEAQKEAYLPSLCRGDRIAALAMTEPDSGSNAYGLSTLATPCDDGFYLDGHKTWITNSSVADLLIVGARSAEDPQQGAVSAFLVDAALPGVELRPSFEMLGLDTAAVGEVVLRAVQVPAVAVLGRPGQGSMVFQTAMDWERTCLFAAHLGTMDRLLGETVRFVKSRRLGGKSLAGHQAISHTLADLKVQLEAARLLVYRAAWQIDRGRSATLHAAMAKLFTSEALLQTAISALRLHGGQGLLQGSDLEQSYRDAVASTLYSGTSEIQRNLIAGFLGLR